MMKIQMTSNVKTTVQKAFLNTVDTLLLYLTVSQSLVLQLLHVNTPKHRPYSAVLTFLYNQLITS
jgi:hypothetical protein